MLGKSTFSVIPLLALLASNTAAADLGKGAPAFIEARGAQVVKTEKAPGGMTAYTVMKDGKLGVFFASPDKTVVMLGVMFDAKTGENLSDRLLPTDQQTAQLQAVPGDASVAQAPKIDSKRAMANLRAAEKAVSDTTSLAEHILSDGVPGVIEGKASKATTFVFFDPLCPYCHKLYDNTRNAVKDGRSIKWIPVNIRGDEGLPLSSQILKDGLKAMDALSLNRLKGGPLTSNDRALIDQNTAFMYTVSKKMGMNVATPTILFLNEKSGKLSIAQDDGSNPQIYKAAFGKK